MYLVLSGNRVEAHAWAKQERIKDADWVYIESLRHIRRLPLRQTLVCLGTWSRRQQRYEMRESLSKRCAKETMYTKKLLIPEPEMRHRFRENETDDPDA